MSKSNFENFLQVYYSCLGNCTYERSYEQAEVKWTDKHGKRRYKNYDVFKSLLSRFIKNSKQ